MLLEVPMGLMIVKVYVLEAVGDPGGRLRTISEGFIDTIPGLMLLLFVTKEILL